MPNIFRQAAELLKAKDNGNELTEEELNLMNNARAFAANELPKAFPKFNELPCSAGLERLAKIVEEAKQ